MAIRSDFMAFPLNGSLLLCGEAPKDKKESRKTLKVVIRLAAWTID